MKPDTGLTDILKPAATDGSIVNKDTIQLRLRARIKFKMAVTITAAPQNGMLEFQGTKNLAHENGKVQQNIRISGRLHPKDIAGNRSINSADVADLAITIQGAPVARSKNIQMKQTTAPDGTVTPAAELSEQEKQQLLLDYINKVLGESELD